MSGRIERVNYSRFINPKNVRSVENTNNAYLKIRSHNLHIQFFPLRWNKQQKYLQSSKLNVSRKDKNKRIARLSVVTNTPFFCT